MAAPRSILMLPYGHSLARVSRLLEIAKRLKAMGSAVAFAGSGKYLRLAREAGFGVEPLMELDADVVARHANRASLGFHNRESIERFVEAELAMYREHKPALVVSDFRPTARISTSVAGLPYASITNAMYTEHYSAWRRAPQTHPLTRIIPAEAIYLLLPIVPLINAYYCRPYNQVLRRYGLPRRSRMEQLLSGDLTLLADIPKYGPTRSLPSNFRYVGPITWEPDLPPPDWYDSLDGSTTTIYFTLGSTGSRPLFEIAKEAFGETDYQVLLTTGGIAEAGPWPVNFRVAGLAPGSKLMQASHLLVYHGGNGTAYQALQHGLPMVGIPSNLDQEWNVDRLVDLGVAEKLTLRDCRRETLLDAVRKVLGDGGYRRRAQELQAELSRWNGPDLAARYLSDFAAGAEDS